MVEQLQARVDALWAQRADVVAGREQVRRALQIVEQQGGAAQASHNVAHSNGVIETLDAQIAALEELLAPNEPVAEPTGAAAD